MSKHGTGTARADVGTPALLLCRVLRDSGTITLCPQRLLLCCGGTCAILPDLSPCNIHKRLLETSDISLQ